MSEASKVRAISQDRVTLSRSARAEWTVSVPSGTAPEDLLNPEYWKHIAAALKFNAGDAKGRIGDDVLAICEDRSWRALYEVRDVGPTHITLSLVAPGKDGVCRYVNPVKDLALETDTHYVKWINIGHKHAVCRKSDNEIIEKGFKTAQQGAAWMHKHCEQIAA